MNAPITPVSTAKLSARLVTRQLLQTLVTLLFSASLEATP